MYRLTTAQSSVELAEHRPDEADNALAVGEDADDVGTPADFGLSRSCGLLLQIAANALSETR